MLVVRHHVAREGLVESGALLLFDLAMSAFCLSDGPVGGVTLMAFAASMPSGWRRRGR